MTINMQKGKVEWIENQWVPFSNEVDDEFAGHCLVHLAGTGPTTFSHIANGAVRIGITTDEDSEGQVQGPLAFELDECSYATLYVRFRSSDADKSSIFIGFTDRNDDAEVPMEDEDGTLASVATDAVGILLEGEQDTTWQTVGVQNGTDNAQAAIGTGTGDVTVPDYATDSEWKTAIIELTPADSGTMKVYLEDANDQLVLAATRTSFFRTSVALAPTISADGRATAYNLDVCEFGWSGNRGSFFD